MAADPVPFDLAWVADRALRVALGEGISEENRRRVAEAFERVRRAAIPGLVDAAPAYASLLLAFDLDRLDPARAEAAVRAALADPRPVAAPVLRRVEVPVCFDGDAAPDLDAVAKRHGLERVEVVALLAAAEFVVAFTGFSPGFPYLEGLPPRLSTPRLARPRLRVPAGSVAIAGAQAGIYPRATPGGWNLVGRTPLPLFDPARDPPSLLRPGDRIRFVPVPRAALDAAAAGSA